MSYLLLLASAGFGVAAYSFYFKDTVSAEIKPNRWSWLIWSITTAVESVTYHEVSGDWMKSTVFFLSAVCCGVVTARIWTKSKWQTPDWSEVVSIVASLGALGIWFKYRDVLGAHYLVVGALPIAFFPTWKEAWKDFGKEFTWAWPLWTIGDFFAILLILSRFEKREELPYAVMECLCHLVVWGIVAFKRREALDSQV